MRAQLLGLKFGRLTVIKLAYIKWHKCHWLCKCECGGKTITTTQRLKSGHTRSCGCLAREISRKNRLNETKHGHTSNAKPTRTYITWQSMKRRCLNSSHKDYKHYGEKGITITPRWHDFSKFLADMGERPEGKTIDRIDNSKGYTKTNCRWATSIEQIRNSRTPKLSPQKVLTIFKDTRPQKNIAKKYGVSQACISLIKTRRTWRDVTEKLNY